jgi:hypothetical protein
VPNNITNVSGLVVDGKKSSGDIKDGINLGDINEGDSIVVTYTANVAGEGSFGFGQTTLTNVASVSVDGETASSEAMVTVSKTAVYAATTVSTGFDGGSAAAVIAGLAGMLLIAAYTLRDKIGAMMGKRNRATELEKKIDFVKKNNLINK